MTTYTFEEATWAEAEVWAWAGGEGTMIGRAGFVNPSDEAARISVWLDNGRRSPSFRSPADALAWVEENA